MSSLRVACRLTLATLTLGCAGQPAAVRTFERCVLLAHDDGRVDGAIAFPTQHHESLVRFELPPGRQRPRQLWIQAASPGTLAWALYDETPLEGPGFSLLEGTLVIGPQDVSDGRDGRWLLVDVSTLGSRQGALWLGLRRRDGAPQVAASAVDAGQYFLRNHDPLAPVGLLPVRRTPLVRLELARPQNE